MVELRGPPRLKTQIPHSNPWTLKTHKEIWDQNEVGLILDVCWFNIPTPVELRGSPRLKIPIPPSNPPVLNTYKEIWNQNESWANFRCLVI
jgi:hypothetical protein